MSTKGARLLGVEGNEVPGDDVVDRQSRSIGDDLVHIGTEGLQSDDRCSVILLVELQSLFVNCTIEVDSQLRDTRDRASASKVLMAVFINYPTSELDFTVGPASQQRAAIDLYSDLRIACGGGARVGLHTKTGRIRVRTHNTETGEIGSRRLRDDPSNGSAIATQDVGTGLAWPLLVLVDDRGTGCTQTVNDLLCRMK